MSLLVRTTECRRRGAAIDLVADRRHEARNSRVAKAARPNVAIPTARAAGLESVEIVIDTRERYAWKFTQQHVTTTRPCAPRPDRRPGGAVPGGAEARKILPESSEPS